MVTVTKAAILALVLGACPIRGINTETIPLDISWFTPPPEYQVWADRAIDCAKAKKEADPSLPYTVIMDSINVFDVTWGVVATEKTDGGFPCYIEGKLGYCIGQSTEPDTIWLSSKYVYAPWVVKHEILHLVIDKGPDEWRKEHGVPWGLCEWF